MDALDLDHANATIAHLAFVLDEFKTSINTSGSRRLQKRAQKIHISDANEELDKIREILTPLRARMVYAVRSIDAALVAAKEEEKRAERMALENEGLMMAFQKQNRAANERMMNAQKENADAHQLMKVAQKKNMDAHELMKVAQKEYADAHQLMRFSQKEYADAHQLMKDAQAENAEAVELIKTAQKKNAAAENRFNAAVLFEKQLKDRQACMNFPLDIQMRYDLETA